MCREISFPTRSLKKKKLFKYVFPQLSIYHNIHILLIHNDTFERTYNSELRGCHEPTTKTTAKVYERKMSNRGHLYG